MKWILVCVVAPLCIASVAFAEMPRTVWVLSEIYDSHPEVKPYIEGVVNGLYEARVGTDSEYNWLDKNRAYVEGSGGQKKRPMPLQNCLLTASELSRAQLVLPSPRCEKMIQDTVAYVWKITAEEAEAGKGRSWMNTGRRGPGGILMFLSWIHERTPQKEIPGMLERYADILKSTARQSSDENGKALAWWFTVPRKKKVITGVCYGMAGAVWGLYEAYEIIPDHRFSDGTSLLDLGNAALNWLAANAQAKQPKGIVWALMRVKSTKNTGLGSGVAGIGAQFLKGWELNKKSNPGLARYYLETAMDAARGINAQILSDWDYKEKEFTYYAADKPSHLNLGYCGGIGGTSLFLLDLIPVIQDIDPELATQSLKTCNRFADCFVESSVEFNGGRAWLASPQTVLLSLDYGLTGILWCVNRLNKKLEREDLEKLENDALTALLNSAIKEGDGYTWANEVSLDEMRER